MGLHPNAYFSIYIQIDCRVVECQAQKRGLTAPYTLTGHHTRFILGRLSESVATARRHLNWYVNHFVVISVRCCEHIPSLSSDRSTNVCVIPPCGACFRTILLSFISTASTFCLNRNVATRKRMCHISTTADFGNNTENKHYGRFWQ